MCAGAQWKFHELIRGWDHETPPPSGPNPANFRTKVASRRPSVPRLWVGLSVAGLGGATPGQSGGGGARGRVRWEFHELAIRP